MIKDFFGLSFLINENENSSVIRKQQIRKFTNEVGISLKKRVLLNTPFVYTSA